MISYSFDPTHGLLTTVVAGQVSAAEVTAYLHEVATKPWFPAPSVTDVRDAAAASGEEVRAIADGFRSFGTRFGQARIAVLVDSDVSYGLVRMISLLLDDVATIRPFRDQALARAWALGAAAAG
jgi:hypothetical protein